MAPAHGAPHDDEDEQKKLKEALHGGRVVPPVQPPERLRLRRRRGLPTQASATAKARSGGQQGIRQRSETAAEKAQGPKRRRRGIPLPIRRAEEGAVVQGPDGTTIVPLADAREPLVENPKLDPYDAIKEVID